jgi:nucleoside-diphosphate-sugar epimerase
MKVLITGGNGYIASSLNRGLKSLHDITNITRLDFDLTDSVEAKRWFEGRWFDAVIHTAIVGGSRLKTEDEQVIRQNLLMHYNLLSNKDCFGRFITFGSGAEMFSPDTPYGTSKRIIAESIKATDNWYNLRIFAVFDENELNTRFIKANLMRYLRKEPMQIHSNRLMDFFYMKDLIALVQYYLTEDSPSKEVNCSYPNKYTLTNIASIINQMGSHQVPIVVEENGKLGVYCGDGESLPINTVGLRTGIRETFEALSLKENTKS